MRPDKAAARAAGIPKWLRRHAQRYGAVGTKHRDRIDHMLQDHKKYPVLKLDHGRDRALKRIGVASLPTRTPIEGIIHAA